MAYVIVGLALLAGLGIAVAIGDLRRRF